MAVRLKSITSATKIHVIQYELPHHGDQGCDSIVIGDTLKRTVLDLEKGHLSQAHANSLVKRNIFFYLYK